MMFLKYIIVLSIVATNLVACDNQNATDTPKQLTTNTNTDTSTLPKTRKHNAEVINFEGFGPAKFGDNEESIRIAWGRPLEAGKPEPGATCYYLYKEAIPQQNNGIAFMLEDGKFVRYDVDDPSIVAPGGIVVGDHLEKILTAHQGHVNKAPHKYIQGAQTLTIHSTEHENASLIFEIDSSGTIVHWRIGVVPQVEYVEGCG